MGIHGLWKLLEPAGKDVTLESLENKILAIDVSLWLHQAQQGTNRGEGGNHPNAHLLTLFHRISKLLYYRIKPVFVFDGVAPALKKKTISIRNQRKQIVGERAEEIRQKLLRSLVKSGAIDAVLQKNKILKPLPEPSKTKNGNEAADEEMYNLPPMPVTDMSPVEQNSEDSRGSGEGDELLGYCEGENSSGKSETGSKEWKKWSKWVDPHEVDVQNEAFKALPVEVRREILTDLKEARKESSWGRLHKMPKNLDSFSSFQMSRLLHRRKVQEVWEDVEKELATTEVKGASLGELEAILSEKGVNVDLGLGHHRIASDEKKGYVLLSGLSSQNTVSEADEKTNLTLLKAVKEEPEESEEEAEDKFPIDKELRKTKRRLSRSESLRDPGSVESEMLNEKKVKDFIKVAIGGSEDGSEAGDDSESKEELWGEPEDGLSQAELLELIKEQTASNLQHKNSNDIKKETESELAGIKSKEVSVSTSVKDNGKDSHVIKEIRLEIESNIKNQMVDIGSSEYVELVKADAGTPSSKAVRGSVDSGKQDKSLKEGEAATAEIYLDSEEELSETEINVNEQLKTKDVKDKVSETRSPFDVVVTRTFESYSKEEEDKNGKKITEDLSEEVIVEEKEREELTQEEILAMIRIHSNSTKEDKTKDCSVVGTSDSEMSEFLEVEEVVANEEKKTAKAESTELSCNDRNVKVKGNKDLEVIIHPGENPDDSTDIFADVFENCSAEEDVATVNKETSLIEKASDSEDTPTKVDDNSVKVTDASMPEKLADEEKMPPTEDVMDETLTEEERHRMTLEMKKLEREASAGVTERARLESQELLGLFGVPWIVAPFEAEAQCAFLESSSPKTPKFGSSSTFRKFLAEGTVTEDSDVWAFGASAVYRHVFDRRRTRVRLYTKEDICKKLGLNRIRVVQLALLTGSDYTIGLPGVGTVTALEILAAFPGEKLQNPGLSADLELDDVLGGLQHFADWWKRVEVNEEKGVPVGHSYFDPAPAVAETLRRRLLACWKALQSKQPGASLLPPGFPSRAVAQAYLKPSVDECRDTFTWLKPDEAALQSYAQLHFGWTKDKTDSILRPLFARLKLSDCKDRTQMSLHSFFSHIQTDPKPGDLECSHVGVRALKALERIAGKFDDLESSKRDALDEDVKQQQEGSGKKAKKSSAKAVTKTGSSLEQRLKSGRKVVKQKISEERPSNMKTVNPSTETGFSSSLYASDNIPQRQKDNNNALQSKLKAIEVLRKSSMGRGKRAKEGVKKGRGRKKLKRAEADLSESSDSN